ncbi:MAG TPA: chaperonin GroEL, partial [Coleofasciculaceae cyanobacterium]
MVKIVSFSDESRRALENGVNALADAVRVTLGPKGRNVLLEKKFGIPSIVNDGITIAKEIELENPLENAGARLVREVATKTKDIAGDGTTTATVLAQAMVREGLKNVTAGANPVPLRRGIDKTIARLMAEINTLAQPISGNQAIAQIATVAAGSDPEIGNTIAEAFERVTQNGVITVEESKSLTTEMDVVEGMQFDRGYTSPYFVTDSERMIVELNNVAVLLTDGKINNLTEIVGILEGAVRDGRSLLIIAQDIEGDALSTLVINKLRGVLSVAAVKAPGFGERRKFMLEDIALVVGGQLVCEDAGMTLESSDSSVLGFAQKVTISKDSTTIVAGDQADKAAIEARVHKLKEELATTDSDYDTEKLQERIARLIGGVAVIKVGAATETELKERKLRIEDAVNATKAAIAEGVIGGGGATLMQLAKVANEFKATLQGEEAIGADIVARALTVPLRQIADNAGYEGSVVVEKVREHGGNIGFNALTGNYEDTAASGIIDPA